MSGNRVGKRSASGIRRPLDGVRVLDLTTVLAGPYCTYQLALLGAEVIKVEVPDRGDLGRSLGADETLNELLMGASFMAQNAGKKSVSIDLKSADGKAALRGLIGDADVLVENFRPGVLSRLGFPWPALRELNASLIYCAISGFGQTGPMSAMPAYDQVVQGLSGIMSITGTSESGPLRAGFPVCDSMGGLAAALAITAALHGRSATGSGCMIDVSMLEVALSSMGWVLSNYLMTGAVPEPLGNDNFTAAPSGTFTAADGLVNIAANRQEQFERLCRTLDRPDLLEDERFQSRAARLRHRTSLTCELNRTLIAESAAHWEDKLTSAGVPAGRVLTVPEALGLEQVRERGFVHRIDGTAQGVGDLSVVGSGVQIDGRPLCPEGPPPVLGAHTATYVPSAESARPGRRANSR